MAPRRGYVTDEASKPSPGHTRGLGLRRDRLWGRGHGRVASLTGHFLDGKKLTSGLIRFGKGSAALNV